MRAYLRAFQVGLGFLTTLPVPLVREWRSDDLRLAVRAYPLVGLVIGVILAAAFALLGFLPPLLLGVLITALWLGLTGGLHFDGYCDLADAMLASKSREERWRIVKDPQVGAFALMAGTLLILTKVAAVGGLALPAVLLGIPVLSRTVVIWAMARYPVHDVSLLGRNTSLTWNETVLPFSLSLLLTTLIGLVWLEPAMVLALVGVALATTVLLARWLNERMQGLGGDAYGAIIEVTEAVMLVAAVTLLSWTQTE